MARRSHPFPYRTRKLSFSAPMVVGTRVPVRVGRCQAHLKNNQKWLFFCVCARGGGKKPWTVTKKGLKLP